MVTHPPFSLGLGVLRTENFTYIRVSSKIGPSLSENFESPWY